METGQGGRPCLALRPRERPGRKDQLGEEESRGLAETGEGLGQMAKPHEAARLAKQIESSQNANRRRVLRIEHLRTCIVILPFLLFAICYLLLGLPFWMRQRLTKHRRPYYGINFGDYFF